jgi:hypothetical protein
LNTDNSHVYVALLHYPVYDKHGRVVVTSITNHDIHDIARVAKTYALGGYYLVTPLLSQQELCRRIIRHWIEGFGSRYNPTRRDAFITTYLADSLQQVVEQLQQLFGAAPVVIMTSAREHIASECGQPVLSYSEASTKLQDQRGGPYLLVFGTGYGVENDCIRRYSQAMLEPIRGVAGYNHLSVRGAAAIIIDRLFGQRNEQ